MIWRVRSHPIVLNCAVLALLVGTSCLLYRAIKSARQPMPLQFYDPVLEGQQVARGLAGQTKTAPDGHLIELSMVQIIADPKRYHGKAVRVCGFLHVSFEHSAIYLSREDANYLITRNGLWVSSSVNARDSKGMGIRSEFFDRKYVLVEGIFDMESHGHLGAWPGTIRDVWRVMEKVKSNDD
jgi:hypothetical protein